MYLGGRLSRAHQNLQLGMANNAAYQHDTPDCFLGSDNTPHQPSHASQPFARSRMSASASAAGQQNPGSLHSSAASLHQEFGHMSAWPLRPILGNPDLIPVGNPAMFSLGPYHYACVPEYGSQRHVAIPVEDCAPYGNCYAYGQYYIQPHDPGGRSRQDNIGNLITTEKSSQGAQERSAMQRLCNAVHKRPAVQIISM